MKKCKEELSGDGVERWRKETEEQRVGSVVQRDGKTVEEEGKGTHQYNPYTL